MPPSSMIDSLREFLALEAQVLQARMALQQTSELDPEFEVRLLELMDLVDRRDQVLSLAGCLPH